VRSAETVLAKREAQACGSGAAREEKPARFATQRNSHEVDTPPRMLPVSPTAGKNSRKRHEKLRRGGETSGSSTRSARRSDTLREDVIGRRMAVASKGFGRRSGSFAEDGAFALIHEPAGEHGRRVFLEILIEEGSQLLAEIGGVSEAGEFIGLQRVAGSGEQELPGRLGVIGVHENLLEQVLWKSRGDSSILSNVVTSNPRVTRLWKSMQSVENALRACSGCAGDYEDPDRSAWEPDPEEDTENSKIRKREEPAAPGDEERPEAE
jgi:hypothetical protein